MCIRDRPDVGAHSLEHLGIEVAPNLVLLPAGGAAPSSVSIERLLQMADGLKAQATCVVADVGVLASATDPGSVICVNGDRTTCVLRACYLALRRYQDMAITVDDVVEIEEPGRALTTIDIEAVVGKPVAARIPFDPAIARTIDSGGLTSRRTPRPLRRGISQLLGLRTLGLAP